MFAINEESIIVWLKVLQVFVNLGNNEYISRCKRNVFVVVVNVCVPISRYILRRFA